MKQENSDIKPYRYNSVAIILHWLMAIGFFLMLGSGITMSYIEIDKSFKFQLYQWHKSGGVILLLSFILRVMWRFISIYKNQIPAPSEKLSNIERTGSKLGHYGLYLLMFAVPFSGWVMVSSSVYGLPTIVFDLFEWPHIPNIQDNENINKISKNAHFYLNIIFGLIILTHISAVIKHKIIDKDNLINRIWWSKRP